MKTGPVILILIGLALLAFLYFSPVTPQVAHQHEDTAEQPVAGENTGELSPDAQVEEALRMLESGEVPPMQGIMKIRDVAEKYPGNVKANYTLGVLSLQTGQYDKAMERFNTVLEQQPDDAQVWRLLAEAQLNSGDTTAAKASFENALKLADDNTGDQFKKELPELNY